MLAVRLSHRPTTLPMALRLSGLVVPASRVSAKVRAAPISSSGSSAAAPET